MVIISLDEKDYQKFKDALAKEVIRVDREKNLDINECTEIEVNGDVFIVCKLNKTVWKVYNKK